MVEIDRVYSTTQNLLNIEQRGYLPPAEFDNFASLAQLDIFEHYFDEYNKYENGKKAGRTNTEFADMPKHFRERINLLSTTGTVTNTDNLGTYTLPTNLYRLTRVTIGGLPIEEEMHDENTYAQLSPLARSVASRPTFLRFDNTLRVTPINLASIDLTYLRQPATPKWAYATINNTPIFDTTNSVNFEIHAAEESELIIKILFYAGVAIKDPTVIQAAQAAMQLDNQMENLPFK